jgi:hypothetical protein
MHKSISICRFLLLLATVAFAQSGPSILQKALSCDDQSGVLCTEVFDSIGYGGAYTGHDEPSVLFYSNVAGSGNTGVYLLQLPKDPSTLPKQDGTGGRGAARERRPVPSGGTRSKRTTNSPL